MVHKTGYKLYWLWLSNDKAQMLTNNKNKEDEWGNISKLIFIASKRPEMNLLASPIISKSILHWQGKVVNQIELSWKAKFHTKGKHNSCQ